jgi:hypothetical protein
MIGADAPGEADDHVGLGGLEPDYVLLGHLCGCELTNPRAVRIRQMVETGAGVVSC